MRRVFGFVLALLLLAAGQASAAAGPGPVDARAWAVLDVASGELIGASSARQELPIASATKLMTALVALDRLDPGEQVQAEAYAVSNPAESIAGLEAGDTYTVGDLLYALLMASANDAAVELARAAAGTTEEFVALMNRHARRLGLRRTSFANPIGFDDPANHSTAGDLTRLAAALLRDPLAARISDTEEFTIRSGLTPIEIENRNTLLRRAAWVDGVKTGQTSGAGYVLVGSGTRQGRALIATVLGSSSEAARDEAAIRLLRWGFRQVPADQGEDRDPAERRPRGDDGRSPADESSPLLPIALIVVGSIVILAGVAGARSRREKESP